MSTRRLTLNLRPGSGFNVRNRTLADIDDDIDIEEGDEAVFGQSQFTEHDIIRSPEDEFIDVGQERALPASSAIKPRTNGVGTHRTSNEIQSYDQAIRDAQDSGDMAALVLALERKLAHFVRFLL